MTNRRLTARAVTASREIEQTNVWMARLMAALVAVAVLLSAGAALAKSPPESFAGLAKRLLPTVVSISTTQTVEGRSGFEMPQLPPGSPLEDFFKDFFDRENPQNRSRRATFLGSGFILDNKGHVITNNHVIQDAEEISVILNDDKRLKAEIVGRDPETDLAVLKVDFDGDLPTVKMGDSNDIDVGDWVIAIGNPFGLGGTVTAGIISARGRDINAGRYDNFLQTDASINRGNSGGPMFNMDGEVIGINTAIFSPTGGSVGIGFAIPTSTAIPVINQLINNGEVRRGWLGVHIQSVTDEIAESLGLKEARGAMIVSVIENGPASKSDFKASDVILKFNGEDVTETRSLQRIVADVEPDSTVDVVIWREGNRKTVQVTIGEFERDTARLASRAPAKDDGAPEREVEALGIKVASINDKLRAKFELGAEAKGVIITEVDAEGPAAGKGLQPGDIIVQMSQQDVTDPGEIARKVEEAREQGRKSVLLRIISPRGVRFVAIRLE